MSEVGSQESEVAERSSVPRLRDEARHGRALNQPFADYGFHLGFITFLTSVKINPGIFYRK